LDALVDSADRFEAMTLDDTIKSFEQHGWTKCGKVNRSDGKCVDMMSDGHLNYIAIWQEDND
jgi:hypothetical protein